MNNHYGICLDWSNGNYIKDNSVSNNEFGIYLRESSNNEISHNKLIDNTHPTGDSLDDNWWHDNYIPSNEEMYWSAFLLIPLILILLTFVFLFYRKKKKKEQNP